MEQNELKEILSHFATQGNVSEIKPLGEGLINDTYLVKTAEADQPDYVLQRVNADGQADTARNLRITCYVFGRKIVFDVAAA